MYQEKIKICVSGAAELTPCCDGIVDIAKKLGREIAKSKAVLLTGATTGVPYYSAEGYKKAKGFFSLGFSPANSRRQHVKAYKLPVDQFDSIVYTGFDYVGRDLILVKSADALIIACGRTGTLHEFTVAFESKLPIGVLTGTGGTADSIKDFLKKMNKKSSKIVYSNDPKELVAKVNELVKKDRGEE